MKKLLSVFFLNIVFFLLTQITFSQDCKVLKGHTGNVLTLAYSPDGSYLVSGDSDDNILLWNAETGSFMKKLNPLQEPIYKILFLSENDNIVVSSKKSMIVYNISNEKKRFIYQDSPGQNFTISPDGKCIAVCKLTGYDNIYAKTLKRDGYCEYELFKYNILTGESETKVVKALEYSFEASAWGEIVKKDYRNNYKSFIPIIYSHDNNYYSFSNCIRYYAGSGIYIFRKSDNSIVRLIDNFCVMSHEFSLDDKYLIGSPFSPENQINIYSLEIGENIKTLKGHEDIITALCLYPNSKYIASASKDETVRIWDIQSGKTIKVLKGHTNDVNCLAFSQNGKYLASGSDDETIRLWDVSNLNDDFKSYVLEYELNIGLAKKFNKEKETEIKLLDDKFKPKGEFETTEEYNLRISNADAEKLAIEQKYDKLIEEVKNQKASELTGFKNQVEDENQKKIEESVRDTLLKISNIGSYNADNETFPITINYQTEYINIPRSDAVEFKNVYAKAIVKAKKRLNSNLSGWEYYDIIIINPNNNAEYRFK